MNEDLPLSWHTVLMCWMAFIIGTVVLLITPGILISYNYSQISSGNVVSSAAVSQPSKYSSSGRVDLLFHSIIQEASDRYEVEPELIRAIIMAESSYNPNAVSRRGARGLMQLMPSTARALGVEDSFNPEHNIHGGVKYFKQLLDRFDGDVSVALAAYNAGSRKVREYQGIPPFKATHYYIKKVFSYYNHYKTTSDKV